MRQRVVERLVAIDEDGPFDVRLRFEIERLENLAEELAYGAFFADELEDETEAGDVR